MQADSEPDMTPVSTPVSTLAPYEAEIVVQPADIDWLGHVNNMVYLRWVQDMAIEHWSAAASAEEKSSLLWVVSRHEIDYKRPVRLDDVILARTWVGEAKRRLFERHTELRRKADDKLLARALTLWCPVDPDSKRPVDVSAEVYARFSTNHG